MNLTPWLEKTLSPENDVFLGKGFSFVPPLGWKTTAPSGLKVKVIAESLNATSRITILSHPAKGHEARSQEDIDQENEHKPLTLEDWKRHGLGDVIGFGRIDLDQHPCAMAILDPVVKKTFNPLTLMFAGKKARMACLLVATPGAIWQVVGSSLAPTSALAQEQFNKDAPLLLGSMLTFSPWQR